MLMRLHRYTFHNAYRRSRRNDRGKPESRLLEWRVVLRLRPFLPSRPHQHHHVEHLAQMRCVILRELHFKKQQLRVRLHRAAAVSEDGQALIFGPVVNDVREQIGIAAGGNGFEKSCPPQW